MKEHMSRLLLLLAAITVMVGLPFTSASADTGAVEVAEEGEVKPEAAPAAEAAPAEAAPAEAAPAEAAPAEEKKAEAAPVEEKKPEAAPPVEEKKPEVVEEPPADAPEPIALTEEELEYVELAGTVACYREQTKDPTAQGAEIAYYLVDQQGIALDAYEEKRKTHASKAAIQDAIKAEMELCPSRVLERPTAEVEPEKPEKKKDPYRNRYYKTSVSGSGVTGGMVSFRIKKNGKDVNGTFKGVINKQRFSIQLSGKRKGKKVSLSSTGGKDRGSINVTLNGKKASGKFSGKVRGRNVNVNFTAKAKK